MHISVHCKITLAWKYERDKNVTMATRTTYLGAPEPFDPSSGDDWTLYSERFEHFLLANEIKDEQKLHHLLALVGAQTFRLLTNLVAPKKPGELTYTEVKQKLTAHFKPKPITIAERFRFYKRQQRQGEIWQTM